MDRNHSLGDRYEWKHEKPIYAQVIEFSDSGWVIIKGTGRCSLYLIHHPKLLSRNWQFIGNFGKSTNLTTFYNILNNE